MHQSLDGHRTRDPSKLASLSTIPFGLLEAELQRRQDGASRPSCGSEGNRGAYNTPIHVFALFLIFALSTSACSFPIVARRFPNLPIPHRFLFLSRHFGTGVLIATAFVHLLPTAFISMTDPCLPSFWTDVYPQMPGFIAMLSVFMVVSIEMFFASRGAKHSHAVPFHDKSGSRNRRTMQEESEYDEQGFAMNGRISLESMERPNDHPASHVTKPHENLDEADDEMDDLDTMDPLADESATLTRPGSHKRNESHLSQASGLAAAVTDQDPQKLFLQCLLLEAGILFHSIFIGMAVSVAQGTQFVVLLIAISFHQTFEGFALGARIAALIPVLFDASSPKPWLMALAYGTTTPIGQAIGLWMHNLYDPYSEVGLLMVGITNAISSGLLLFAGLVQLIAEDFLSDHSYDILKGRRRIEASLAVALGGVLMAFVGAFA